MAINTDALVAGLERRLADEAAARKALTSDLLTMYGIVGALLGWFILDPIAAVLGGVAGVLLAYSMYRLDT
jgi:divalent metal cation (Fe/Co/Zn/Cd) transporter